MALREPSPVSRPPMPVGTASRLTDELMGAAGLFGPDGRDVVVMLTLDDRASNRWKATALYRVGKTKTRIRDAFGQGQAVALAALLQKFVDRHAGRRWRLVGPGRMAGLVTRPRPRVKPTGQGEGKKK